MRGQYVPLPCHADITLAASEEIQGAIDAIRFSVDSQAGVRSRAASVRNPREGCAEAFSRASGIVVMGPMDKVDAATTVSLYGRVPRAFLQWFEEVRSQLKDQQQMLEHCVFEESWWSFSRW